MFLFINSIHKKIFPVEDLLMFILTVFLFINSAFSCYAQNPDLKEYEFISPAPNSIYHNPETNIIIRYGEEIDNKNFNDELIIVKGDKSGWHHGKLFLAGDRKTLIFKPKSVFESQEKVQVILNSGIITKSGNYLPELDFCFRTDNNSIVGKSADLELSKKSTASTMKDFPLFTDPFIKVINSDRPAEGNLFTTITVTGGNFIYIYDNEGIPVYARLNKSQVSNFTPQPAGVLSFFNVKESIHITIDKQLNYIDTFRMGNGYKADMHEFVLMENGHAFMLCFDNRIVDLSQYIPGGITDATVVGAVIQELDEDKNVIFEWRSWDHFNITDTYMSMLFSSLDAVHCNSVFPDTDTSMIISCRNMSEITRINRKNGEIIWRMGGKNNQFEFVNETRQFSGQHYVVQMQNRNLCFFDNGLNLQPLYSRGLEYKVDYENKKVWLLREYLHDPLCYSAIMGNLQKLDNSNVLVNWGISKNIDAFIVSEYDTLQNLVFEAQYNSNTYMPYRVYRAAWEPQIFTLNTDTLYFEDTRFGEQKSKEIILKNISQKDQIITSFYCKNNNFNINETFPFYLQAGHEKMMNVEFKPKSTGNFNDPVILYSETDSLFFSKKLNIRAKSTQITGIQDKQTLEIHVIPNPFNDYLYIESEKTFSQIRLLDLSGKICYSSENNGNKIQLSLGNLNKGNYFLFITFADNTTEQKMVTKF